MTSSITVGEIYMKYIENKTIRMSRISESIFHRFHLRRASCDIPDHHHGFREAGVVWHPYLWSPCYWNADAPVWRVWEALFRKWRAVTQCFVNLRSTSKSHRDHYFGCRQEFSNIAYCNIHARSCQGAVSNVTKNLRYTILTLTLTNKILVILDKQTL